MSNNFRTHFFLMLCTACSFLGASEQLSLPFDLKIISESALLINSETGEVLYEKNANALQSPGSITKVSTEVIAKV